MAIEAGLQIPTDTDESSGLMTQNSKDAENREPVGKKNTEQSRETICLSEKKEKRENAHLRLEKLYILNTGNDCLRTAITPDQNVEIATEPIVHRATASNTLERRIAVLVRRLRK